jgi:hypothetical protein
VVRCLRECFCRFGVPHTVVSDNAKEFIAEELESWLRNQGCHVMHTPIYSPRSNGLAERAVQTVKTAMKAWNSSMGPFDQFLMRVLFNHRNMFSSTRGSSPAKILLGRELRMPIFTRFAVGQQVVFTGTSHSPHPEKATYILHKSRNTAWIMRDGRVALASTSHLAPDVQIPAPEPTDCSATASHPASRVLRNRSTIAKPDRFV